MDSKFICYIIVFLLLTSNCTNKNNSTQSQTSDAISICEELGYTMNNGNVYYVDSLLQDADPASFVCLGKAYAKDKNYVFFAMMRSEIADSETFEILTYGYAKDKNHVYFDYYSGKTIEGADPKTFEQIGDIVFSKDKNSVYIQHDLGTIKKLEGADIETFHQLDCGYFADKNFLYGSGGDVLTDLSKERSTYLEEFCDK